jgi:integrase
MALKKLPNGRWEASYRDQQRRERIKRFPTRREADDWLAGVKADLVRGDYVDPRLSRTTFDHWADEWLATTVHLKAKTQVGYESMLRTHVLPAFTDRAISSIHQVDVRRFIAAMADAGAAAGTIRSARKVLRLVLVTAQGSGAIKGNPCDGVRVPRSPRTEMMFLDARQVEQLAEEITPPYGTLIRFAAYTGLRAGEIGALRVGRLDLLRGRVEVAESMTEVHGHGLVFGPTKTYERRSVPVLPSLRDELTALIATRARDESALVFTSPTGDALRHRNFYDRHFKPAIRRAGLPEHTRFHDLRHTCAALLIALGAHPKAIQERLGHSSITVTLDRYGHLFPSIDEALTTRFDELRREALAPTPDGSHAGIVHLNEPRQPAAGRGQTTAASTGGRSR